MKNTNVKSIFIPAVSLFLICLVVTTLLTITNTITRPTIDTLEKNKAESTKKIVLPEASSFVEMDSMENTFKGLDNSQNTIGYVFITSQKGYGGEIKVMTGISKDNKVEGVSILSQNETPGLGTNTTNDNFRNQYKKSVPINGFNIVKSEAKDGEIEAITGATISSKAVTDAVNCALEKFYTIKESSGE